LRYTAGNPISNPVLNSAMQVWQRSTSTALSAGVQTFVADRYEAKCATANITVSRQATGDTTNLPNIQYSQRVQRTAASTGTSTATILQNVETINSIPFAGKTITFSFYARKGANYSQASSAVVASLISGTGTDQNAYSGFTGSSTIINQSAVLTTTWQRFTYNGTVASTATQLAMYFDFAPVGTAGAADYYEITGIQIDIGSVALPFRTNGATIQGELAACQRYYWRSQSTEISANHGYGPATNTTNAYINIKLPVTMRVRPTAVESSTLGVFDGVSAVAVSSLVLNTGNSGQDTVMIDCTTGGVLVATRGYILRNQASGSAYIALSAEL
jgi:hypothetical protein